MTDRLTPQQRHKCMSAIRSKDTKPEMIVRHYLWRHGYRYRLNYRRLPGKPDIVLRMYRTCIFVHGCFWHGHEGCKYYTTPKSNTDFWTGKVARNKKRDAEVQQRLARMGWYCITIWECQLLPAKRTATLQALEFTLNSFYLQDHRTKTYKISEEEHHIAAENSQDYN